MKLGGRYLFLLFIKKKTQLKSQTECADLLIEETDQGNKNNNL